jgi:hypothetical protein
MVKKLGAALQTGVTASGISGVHEQTGSKRAGGEFKTYYDKDGNEISVYTFDDHKEYSWTALIETTVADKSIGDSISIDGETDPCLVTQWEVTEQNDDVKRVNIGARTFPDITASGQSQTPAAGNGN